MFKFIHTADIHLGASNQPIQYREQALPLLIADARSLGISDILMVGDVFDKDQPNQKIKDYLLYQVVNAPDIRFIITIGNHDYATKAKDYHSLMTYSILDQKVSNVIICEAGVYDLGSFLLVALPDEWGSLPDGIFPSTQRKPVVCAWHGSLLGYDTVKEIDAILRRTGADYLALGDIHKHTQLHSRCWYPGALTQKTYACEDGYVLVGIDGDVVTTQSCHLDLPKRFNLSVTFDVQKDTAESVVDAVRKEVPAGNLVRLKFNLMTAAWAALNKKKIYEELLTDYLEVKLHNDPVTEEIIREGAKKLEGLTDINEELMAMVDDEDTPLDKAKLLLLCKNYLAGVRHVWSNIS